MTFRPSGCWSVVEGHRLLGCCVQAIGAQLVHRPIEPLAVSTRPGASTEAFMDVMSSLKATMANTPQHPQHRS